MAAQPQTPLAIARQVLDIELAGLRAVRANLHAQLTKAAGAMAGALARRLVGCPRFVVASDCPSPGGVHA